MVEYLAKVELPALLVLTKIDKLKRSERERSIKRALTTLDIAEAQLLPFSSKTGEGREDLLEALEGLLHDQDRP